MDTELEELKEQLKRIEYNSLLAAKKVLCLEDVALLTGLSKSHLYSLTCAKKIPYYKPNGKQIYFDGDEVFSWMKQNRISSNDELDQQAQRYCMKGGVK